MVANKIDGLEESLALADFARLGMGDLVAVSGAHNRGLDHMMRAAGKLLPPPSAPEEEEDDQDLLRLAIIGRPNVGKSSLVYRILGEERVLVTPIAGTTRDPIDTLVKRYQHDFPEHLAADKK